MEEYEYFDELLDSYDRLKKRTFKITYLSEEEMYLAGEEDDYDSQNESSSFNNSSNK